MYKVMMSTGTGLDEYDIGQLEKLDPVQAVRFVDRVA